MERLKILVFAKLHQPRYKFLKDFILELKRYADVRIWSEDRQEADYVLRTLEESDFIPDFIFYYDFAYDYVLSPRIYGLNYIDIPKGVYYIDLQTQTEERKEFVYENKIDMVFSPTKDFFFRTLPELKSKFKWLPFSINPDIFKNWKLQKDIDFLLMGRLGHPRYSFRNKVLEKMGGMKGFVYHKPPYEQKDTDEEIFLGEEYAKEINRAKIFFTCGTTLNYPVAKYFEVPACNTLLIAKGNKDLRELGFINGETFIECNDENFCDLAMYYLSHVKERNRITRNGYNLVHSRHTNSVRAVEFINIIKSYLYATKI
jgi:hypothetical protein